MPVLGTPLETSLERGVLVLADDGGPNGGEWVLRHFGDEFPVAPGTLMTGNETLRSSSISLPALRATWSAPPPGPQGTMNSIGRDGYFS